MLLRLYREERPRAVLIAWDTLDVPTYRHEKFPAYQGGREFDDPLLEQLEVPEFVAACGFQNAKAPGFEAEGCIRSSPSKCSLSTSASAFVACTTPTQEEQIRRSRIALPTRPLKGGLPRLTTKGANSELMHIKALSPYPCQVRHD
jgi:hypothetical protein